MSDHASGEETEEFLKEEEEEEEDNEDLSRSCRIYPIEEYILPDLIIPIHMKGKSLFILVYTYKIELVSNSEIII